MAVATMSSYAPTSSMDISPMGVFVPNTPLVVRREKRRRRRQDDATNISNKTNKTHETGTKKQRHGFVFDANTQDEPVAAAPARQSIAPSSTFVFRVRKDAKPTSDTSKANVSVDASSATAALLKKKERELKRVRLQQRQKDMEQEEKYETALLEKHALSRDQLQLFYAVRDQVKREMRKTMRDFARSAARADILQLTEKSLEAIKSGVTEFMAENVPSRTVETVKNPENERLRALIASYETRIKELSSEEADWMKVKEEISSTTPTSEAVVAAGDEETKESEAGVEAVACDLSVTREIESLQREAIDQVESSALRLQVIQDSMESIDRLTLQAEIQKAQLFDAFHGSVFKAYVKDSKETLRALLRLK